MSASGILGTRRLCSFLFTTSSSWRTATSVLCSSSRSLTLLNLVRFFASKTVIESEEATSFTVSYLRNSCGLSLESAKYVSAHVSFESPEKPDSVINLLKEQGFTNAHISKFIKMQPFMLKTNPRTCILPKLEFFRSCGCPNADIISIFSRNPILLMLSLEKRIVPCYNIMKSVLLSDCKVFKSFQRRLSYITVDPAVLASNIRHLRDLGMLQASLSYLLTSYPSLLFRRSSKFCEIVNEVKQMGFDPAKYCFVVAMLAFNTMSRVTLESKLDMFIRLGLSRDEAWTVFRKQPSCVLFSKVKIMKVMDFILNQMAWKSQDIVMFPQVFLYSLENRIIPRCSVAHVLLCKGLEKEIKLSTLLAASEELFMKRYVTSFQGAVPELLDFYKGRASLTDLSL